MQATRKAAVRFKERSELLDFLLEVSAATTLTLDLDQLLANVAEIVHKVLPYDLFAILLYNDRRRDLRIRYAVGHRDEVVRNLSIALGEGITGTAAAQPRAGAGGRRAQRSALSEHGGRGAHRTGRAHDGARQTGGRDRPAIHAGQRVHRVRPRADAPDRGAGGHRHR